MKPEKPLLKTEYIELPLRISVEQADFFYNAAQKLGMSRNGALVFALRFGGPIVAHIMKFAERQVHDACQQITGGKTDEKLGVPTVNGSAVETGHGTETERRPTSQRKSTAGQKC